MTNELHRQSEVLSHALRRINDELAVVRRNFQFETIERARRRAGVIRPVAVVLRAVARAMEFVLLLEFASAVFDLLRLIQLLHLDRAAEMRARGRNRIKRLALAEDEETFVFQELSALSELIGRADFEPPRLFVKHVRFKRAQEGVSLTGDCDERRADTQFRQERAARSFTRRAFAVFGQNPGFDPIQSLLLGFGFPAKSLKPRLPALHSKRPPWSSRRSGSESRTAHSGCIFRRL